MQMTEEHFEYNYEVIVLTNQNSIAKLSALFWPETPLQHNEAVRLRFQI